MSKTVVLIHGSWHGGWAWQDVIRHLSAKGHHAHAPTLAGHGPGVMCAGITHQGCVDTVVTYIQQHRLKDIILVGKKTEQCRDRYEMGREVRGLGTGFLKSHDMATARMPWFYG